MQISNWNKIPTVKVKDLKFFHPQDLTLPTIARAYGNTYGDASLNQSITNMVQHKNRLEIKDSRLFVSSGYQLKEVLLFCTKQQFMIPVVPGTMEVSIGGMVAADTHGKNHAQFGTIGNWIKSISIITNGGTLMHCSPSNNADLFKSTIGGMGLTGIIVEVEIQLLPLKSHFIHVKNSEFDGIDYLMEQLRTSTSEFKIAWIDIISSKRQYFLSEGDFDSKSKVSAPLPSTSKSIPNFGISLLNRVSIAVFNKKNGHKLRSSPSDRQSIWDFLFPLDTVKNWNHAYGKKGFYQYQFVIPLENTDVIKNLLDEIAASPFIPYLISLKYFGHTQSPGLLSFPRHGFSLAIDFKNEKGIIEFMHQLNTKIVPHGGIIYLAKDCIMNQREFREMYPEIVNFEKVLTNFNGGDFESLLSKRLQINTHV